MTTAVLQIVRDYLHESGVPDAQIEQALGHWGLVPFYVSDALAAVVMVRGPEIHLVLAPQWRDKGAMTRGRIRGVLKPLLQTFGYLTTRLAKGDGTHRLFIDRLGFKPTWSDERFTYFMLTELPFGKGD